MGFAEENIRDLKRFNEIVRVLADYELGIILDRLNLKHKIPYQKRLGLEKQKPEPKKLKEAFEALGPTFVKFGQLMAQRPDVVPDEYTQQLEDLEDDVEEFPKKKATEIIEQELGDIDDIFSEFDPDPIAAASVAQVYEARTNSGERVVVKVLRPGIRQTVQTDMDIIEFFGRRAENHSSRLRNMRVSEIIDQFKQLIEDEMHFEKEARNLEVMRSNMSDMDSVKIPELDRDLSTDKVLVMEYVEGVKCTNEEQLREMDIDVADITHTGIEMGLNQVIRDGMFHADPHPSNFFIDSSGKIKLIDFGMVGKLSKKTRRKVGLLFLHIGNEDIDSAVEVIQDICTVSKEAEIDGFKQDVQQVMLSLRNSRVKDKTLSAAMLEIINSASSRGIYFPTNLVLTGKALLTLEGILLTVNPEARLSTEYKDQIESILRQQYSLKDISKSLTINLLQNKDLITNAPSKINRMLETQSQEKTEVKVETSDHHEDILTASLVLSGAFLIAQALPAYSLKIVGTLFILAAAVLLSKKV